MIFWIFYECSNITDFVFWNLDLHMKYNNISNSTVKIIYLCFLLQTANKHRALFCVNLSASGNKYLVINSAAQLWKWVSV